MLLVTPNPATPIVQPGAGPTTTPSTIQIGSFPSPGGGASGGSDVYRISVDGSPARIWNSHDDIVYALAFDSQGKLLAGTGNRGHIFAINGPEEFADLLKAPASQVTSFAKAPGGGLYAASSNLGKIFVVGPGPETRDRMKAMFSTRRYSHGGDMRNSAALEMSIFSRAAEMSTIQIAIGVRGNRWNQARMHRLGFPQLVTRNGRRFCIREAQSPRSTQSR